MLDDSLIVTFDILERIAIAHNDIPRVLFPLDALVSFYQNITLRQARLFISRKRNRFPSKLFTIHNGIHGRWIHMLQVHLLVRVIHPSQSKQTHALWNIVYSERLLQKQNT